MAPAGSSSQGSSGAGAGTPAKQQANIRNFFFQSSASKPSAKGKETVIAPPPIHQILQSDVQSRPSPPSVSLDLTRGFGAAAAAAAAAAAPAHAANKDEPGHESSDEDRILAQLNFNAPSGSQSSPEPESTGTARGQQSISNLPTPLGDGVGEVTKMAQRMGIGGVQVTADEVCRAMRTKVQVAVPSGPSTPKLQQTRLGSFFSTASGSFSETSRPRAPQTGSVRPTSTHSASFDSTSSLVGVPLASESSTARTGQPNRALSHTADVDMNTAPGTPLGDIDMATASLIPIGNAGSETALDTPVDTETESLPGNSLFGTKKQFLRVKTAALRTDSISDPTPTPSVFSDDSGVADRKRRRARKAVNYTIPTFIDSDSEDGTTGNVSTASSAKTRKRRAIEESDSDATVPEEETEEEEDDDDEPVPEDDGSAGSDADGSELDADDPILGGPADHEMRQEFLNVDLESDAEASDEEPGSKKKKPKAQPGAGPPTNWDVRNRVSAHGIVGLAPGKGPDFSLPPLTNIDDIFDDIVKRAVGFTDSFKDVVEGLKHTTLRVATMCSGTESPILACSLINASLQRLDDPLPPVKIAHQFSAEIEPFKQAYIDRNFRVPILFRDVVEMAVGGCTKATTAYGSVVDIPGNLDLLIVGFSCVDYSNLNNYKKSISDMGQSGATFKSVLTYAKMQKPKMMILENVDGAEWSLITQTFESVGYAAKHVKVDTKLYYLPQTRCRGYMLCMLKEVYGKAAQSGVEKWAQLMLQSRRVTSASFRDFMLPDDDPRLQKALWDRNESVGNVISWEACQGRHEAERIIERLGRKRELTKWVDGGGFLTFEHMDTVWMVRLPERVWDLMELLFLKSAARFDIDIRFKSHVFDLSQNPDRINQVCPSGLASCVTPRGMLFVGDAGRCLSGYEMLGLQGIPIDRISLSHETDDELRDLAGNAMSTTVVGCAIINALVVGWKGLKREDSDVSMATSEPIHDSLGLALPAQLSSLMTSPALTSSLLPVDAPATLKDWVPWSIPNISAMLADAKLSARKCYCEGSDAIAHNPIQACRLCGHTTCVQCGKRPDHEYGLWGEGRITVQEWRRRWAGGWPVRVAVKNDFFAAGDVDVSDPDGDLRSRLHAVLAHALKAPLSPVRFYRGPVWIVEYQSASARLEIHLTSSHPMMYLFAKPDPSWPGDDNLRLLLNRWPVARAEWVEDMFNGSASLGESDPSGALKGWHWLDVPESAAKSKKSSAQHAFSQALGMNSKTAVKRGVLPNAGLPCISIKSTSKSHSSDKSRMGLLDFTSQIQPSELLITAAEYDNNVSPLERVGGRYTLLPNCGTAFSSLYKRVSLSTDPDTTVDPDSSYVGDEMFLFLDCVPLGTGANDYFVFSRFPRRIKRHDVRPVVAVLEPSWRPWNAPKGSAALVKGGKSGNLEDDHLNWEWTVQLNMPGRYIHRPTTFVMPDVPLDLKIWTPESEAESMRILSKNMADRACFRPMPLLSMRSSMPDGQRGIKNELGAMSFGRGIKPQYALSDTQFSTLFGWAFLAIRGMAELGNWHKVNLDFQSYIQSSLKDSGDSGSEHAFSVCSTCAPRKPTIRWCPKPGKGLAKTALAGLKKGQGTAKAISMAAGNGGPLVPTEDAREAGEYEARIKEMPEKVVAWVSSDLDRGKEGLRPDSGALDGGKSPHYTLTVSVSLMMMAHQALSRLFSDTLRVALRHGQVDLDSVSAQWRVETDYIPTTSTALPPFVLGSNIADDPSEQPVGFLLPLRVDQLRSLAWMRRQEGSEPDCQAVNKPGYVKVDDRGVAFEVFDSDEYCAPTVNWRVEVQARAKVWVRGGVVADQVSYGKTVTSLALIHGDHGSERIGANKMDLNNLAPAPHPGLVKTGATLVVCPRHLTAQWRSEVNKFLPHKLYNQAGAVLQITSPAQMLATTGREIANAKIVILSWDVLGHEHYIEALTDVLGEENKPATLAGRGFADFCDTVAEKIAAVCAKLGEDALLESGRAAPKVTRGKPAAKRPSSKPSDLPTLVQFFHFRRVIVDEFSYLSELKGVKPGIFAQLATLSTSSRWLLSGTPPLASFFDIDRMARLLGFSLGSQLLTPSDLRQYGRDQHSKTEIFSAFKEPRSPSWHAARHAHAQTFLRMFVRQNEARLDDPIHGVSCFNYVVPVNLSPLHRAIYLELAQHVNAVDMKNKKASDSSDRSIRLNKSLADSASPEEALLNCASAHDSTVTMERLLQKRQAGYQSIKKDVRERIEKAVKLKKALGKKDVHFQEWRESIARNAVGDSDVTTAFRALFSHAEKQAQSKPSFAVGDQSIRELRDIVVSLRVLTKEFTMRMRSLRFLQHVRTLAHYAQKWQGGGDDAMVDDHADEKAAIQPPACSNPSCPAKCSSLESLRILSYCGHMVCDVCHASKPDAESCPVDGCAAHSHENAVVTLHDLIDDDVQDSALASTKNATSANANGLSTSHNTFGAKLDHIATLLLSLPSQERALLFVATDFLAEWAVRLCNSRGIKSAVVTSSSNGAGASAASSISRRGKRAGGGDAYDDDSHHTSTSAITAFLDPDSKIKVLILNHSSESAAGTNLVRANHVIFLSPTLAPSQQIYEGRMKQAIGRARRYGQTAPVHVYHYVACRTIDVDILEMRERRAVVVHQLPRRAEHGRTGGLPGKVTGFVRPGVKRGHAFEYFPSELSVSSVGPKGHGGSAEGGSGSGVIGEVGAAATDAEVEGEGEEKKDFLPPLEPVRLARVRWQGVEEIALVPRGLVDNQERARMDAREGEVAGDVDMDMDPAAPKVPARPPPSPPAVDGEEMMNDSVAEAVARANDVEVVPGAKRFTSLIKFSAAFQGM